MAKRDSSVLSGRLSPIRLTRDVLRRLVRGEVARALGGGGDSPTPAVQHALREFLREELPELLQLPGYRPVRQVMSADQRQDTLGLVDDSRQELLRLQLTSRLLLARAIW